VNETARKDLVVLVPDKCIEAAIGGLLSRPEALGIRPLRHDIFTHPERDPGCLLRSYDILGPLSSHYERALVVLDRHGCGREGEARETLEQAIVERLEDHGWSGRAEAVVIAPELEAWVWSDSPHVATQLGRKDSLQSLKSWLSNQGCWDTSLAKPEDPKACVDKTLRQIQKPRSSALYGELARRVGLARCTDPAFAKFLQTMRTWFPA